MWSKSQGVSGGIGLSRTCLVKHKQNIPIVCKKTGFVSKWDEKQRRCYHRLLSGCKSAVVNGLVLRFMTLTSKFPILCKSDELQLNKDFQVLRKRILKMFGSHIQYCKVRTNEGNGVLHIVYSGCFIPYRWLNVNWEEIHGAWNVDIQLVSGNPEGISRYFVNQYIAGQSSFVRMSRSKHWLPVGAVCVWNNIKNIYRREKGMDFCVSMWEKWLMWNITPDARFIAKDILRRRRIANYAKEHKNFSDGRMWFLGHGVNILRL